MSQTFSRIPPNSIEAEQSILGAMLLSEHCVLQAVERLKSHRDFVAVLKRRRRVSREDIVVHYAMHDDVFISDSTARSGRRVGLAVSKAVGNAVTRNTVKRRFRVLARKHEFLLPESCDIVLRAKPSAAHADFSSLDHQMAACFEAISRKAAHQ